MFCTSSACVRVCVRACVRVRVCVYLGFEPLYLGVLVLQLCPQLIGGYFLRLHDLEQVDVLLHEHLALHDDVTVTGTHTPKILYIGRCGIPVKATRGRIAYKSYKWSPKWAAASDPNLANAPIADGCLSSSCLLG